MTNLDLFDATCAKILSMLYEQFPLELKLFRDDELGLFDLHSETAEEQTKRLVVSQSITFLKDNCYITYNGWEGQDTTTPKYLMRLTDKGLACLRSEPEGVVGDEDLGSAIVRSVRSSDNNSVDREMKTLVKAVFTSCI